jgi:hypothetical protein
VTEFDEPSHKTAEMTTRTIEPATEPSGPRRRSRGVLSTVLALVFLVLFTASGALQWAHSTLFDEGNFADQAVSMLDSSAVREALADEITTALVKAGPSQIASFQAVLRPAIDALLKTPVFRSILRTAIIQAQKEVLTEPQSGPRGAGREPATFEP